MTNINDYAIFYNGFNQLPKFDAQGNVITDADGNINSATEGLISGVSDFISGIIFKKSPVLDFVFSTTLSEVSTISLKITYTDAGDISEIEVLNGVTVLGKISDQLISDLPEIIGTPALIKVLMTGIAGVFGGGFLGTLLGTVAVTGAVTVGFSLLEGFTTSLVEEAVNGYLGLSPIDLQFTDANGNHNSGLFFKDGMGNITEKTAIVEFLNRAGNVDVNGGKFVFDEFGLNSEYKIYDGTIYQTIANNLGLTLNEFLLAGNGNVTNYNNYIDNFNKIIVI